jgi:hypothetical protein
MDFFFFPYEVYPILDNQKIPEATQVQFEAMTEHPTRIECVQKG